jgi:DNA (cytosine-5)-methyltransferase 1
VRLIGNSVCPDEAEDLVATNASDIIELYQRLAA